MVGNSGFLTVSSQSLRYLPGEHTASPNYSKDPGRRGRYIVDPQNAHGPLSQEPFVQDSPQVSVGSKNVADPIR